MVIIDEIPEVPELLNEVHRLISEFGLRFVLCGSSARKLKRKGYNTLGGRAYPCYFLPVSECGNPRFGHRQSGLQKRCWKNPWESRTDNEKRCTFAPP